MIISFFYRDVMRYDRILLVPCLTVSCSRAQHLLALWRSCEEKCVAIEASAFKRSLSSSMKFARALLAFNFTALLAFRVSVGISRLADPGGFAWDCQVRSTFFLNCSCCCFWLGAGAARLVVDKQIVVFKLPCIQLWFLIAYIYVCVTCLYYTTIQACTCKCIYLHSFYILAGCPHLLRYLCYHTRWTRTTLRILRKAHRCIYVLWDAHPISWFPLRCLAKERSTSLYTLHALHTLMHAAHLA